MVGKEGPDPFMLDDITTVVRIHDELCLPSLTTTLIPCKDKLDSRRYDTPNPHIKVGTQVSLVTHSFLCRFQSAR